MVYMNLNNLTLRTMLLSLDNRAVILSAQCITNLHTYLSVKETSV